MFAELKITLCANPEELAEVAATGAFSLEGTTLCDVVPIGQRNNQPGFQRWHLAQARPVHLIIDLEVQLLETLVASDSFEVAANATTGYNRMVNDYRICFTLTKIKENQ